MKTRTKGFIVSFILVFAMLIGVFTIMPMTASAAGDIVNYTVMVDGENQWGDDKSGEGWSFMGGNGQAKPVLRLNNYDGGPISLYGIEGEDVEWTIIVEGDCKIKSGDFSIIDGEYYAISMCSMFKYGEGYTYKASGNNKIIIEIRP
jgi:hypothetical protein